METYLEILNFLSRDNGRTPMQWDTTQYAGFSTTSPWLPVNANYQTVNVAIEDNDPQSVLNYFRRMTRLRNDHPVLVYGDYELLQREHPTVYAYTRTLGGEKMLILLNFSESDSTIELADLERAQDILINNYEDVAVTGNTLHLKPYQAVIFTLR